MASKYDNVIPNALKLLGGGIIGAGLGLLFAPHAGKETRKDIGRFGRSVARKGDRAVHEFADNVVDFADTVSRKAVNIARTGEKVTHDAGRELLAAFEEGKKRLDRQKRRVERMFG